MKNTENFTEDSVLQEVFGDGNIDDSKSVGIIEPNQIDTTETNNKLSEDGFVTQENDSDKKTVKIKKKIKNKEIPLLKVVEFAKKFSSTGSAFLLATLGIITQTFHNGFLFFSLSSFESIWLNMIQTSIGAFGLSGALLYFTIRAANSESKVIKNLVWAFFIFEIYANLFYWSNKYIISVWGTDAVNWSSMIIAVPFAFMIPFTIKAYAGELKFDELVGDDEDEYEEIEVPDNITILKKMVQEHKNDTSTELENLRDSFDNDLHKISDEFRKIEKENVKNIKVGEKFNLNIDTKDKDGEKTTKVLTSVISK